jgi:murein DD-endopeptidase MepM/ murein hydrolase activator NlpD
LQKEVGQLLVLTMTFPLKQKPALDYKTPPRSFGAARAGGRIHAGCDLYAPIGTDILAVEDGEVIQGPYFFYQGTYALEIKHPSGIVRYGEIQNGPILKPGTLIKEGQVIAKVGRLIGLTVSMIHFEMYNGSATGQLTVFNAPPYMRRKDLINPTNFLDNCTPSVL